MRGWEGGREGDMNEYCLLLGVCWHGNMIYLTLNKDASTIAILLCINPTKPPLGRDHKIFPKKYKFNGKPG